MPRKPPRVLFLEGSPFRALFDAMSAMVFIVDERLVVHDVNLAAARRLGPDAEVVLRRLCGEVLRCLNSGVQPGFEAGPCGDTESCKTCVLRRSTESALAMGPTTRRPHVMRLLEGPRSRETHFIVNATPFHYEGTRYAMLVMEDVTELQELRRLVPICAWCRKVYMAGNFHADVEHRLRELALIDYTHGICPECLVVHFPDEAGGAN